MPDNDMQMFNILFKVVEKIDTDATIAVTKTLNTYKIIVKPSSHNLKKALRIELMELSVILGDVFEFPKTADFLEHIFLSTKV